MPCTSSSAGCWAAGNVEVLYHTEIRELLGNDQLEGVVVENSRDR